MRFRHALVLAILFVAAVALGFVADLPPLLDTLRFTLVIAVAVMFLVGVVRQKALSPRGDEAARGKRRRQWIRGGVLFAGGTLAIALTQPLLGASSPDTIILGFGLGVVAVLASYLMLLPILLEIVTGPISGAGRS
jgi:membrane protease YdiL (CAAX protease family)